MIHCIGDSHAAVFSGEEKMQPCWPERSNDLLPYFRSYRIGTATAYQLENKKGLIFDLLNSINLNEHDKIMFWFGEVDIRAHLYKQSLLQAKAVDLIVNKCVGRYINTVLWFKFFQLPIIIWGPIASWNKSKPYTGPSFASNEIRNKITKLFNDRCVELCKMHDLIFISVFEEMLNEDFTTNTIYLDDWEDCHIHLSQRAMPLILNKFRCNGLI